MILSTEGLVEKLIADIPRRDRIAQLFDDLPKAWDTPHRWKIIREYYAIRKEAIAEAYEGQINPYELGLERFLTPIEAQLWQDIRGLGLPFFMQYPVGRRFVDFGSPYHQIAIEADGAAYHSPEKDAIRDAELHAAGWMVFRIKGRDTWGVRGTNEIKKIARWCGKHYDLEDEDGES